MPIQRPTSNAEKPHMSNHSVREPSSSLPPRRGFKLASLNINKLTTHIDELRILLAYNEIDILSVSETKLDETTTDNEVKIPGYTIVRRDRISNGGGGVRFYVKSSINFTMRKDLNVDTLENLSFEIQFLAVNCWLLSRGIDHQILPLVFFHLSKP